MLPAGLRRRGLVCGTGYTGEDGVEVMCAAGGRPRAVGRADGCRRGARRPRRPRHAPPRGLLPPLRQRPLPDRNPIEAASAGAARRRRASSARTPLPRPAVPKAPPQKLAPVPAHRPRDPATGKRVIAGGEEAGEVTSGTLSPSLEHGIGMAYVRRRAGRARDRGRDRRPRQAPPGTHRVQAALLEDLAATETRRRVGAEETYPEDLKYHPEHDWARVDGDEATFGITWYAQDSLGEVVFFEPPEAGAEVTKDERLRRGRVGQGGLRRLRAALGRGHRGQPDALADSPELDQRGPLRRGLARQGEALGSLRGRRT